VSAHQQSVFFASIKSKEQFSLIAWYQGGAVVVVVLNISIQQGKAVVLGEGAALSDSI
jgi:hypothetical protein